MNTMHMTEEHMGTDATRAEAEHMVGLLRDRGYDIEYGTGPGNLNDIPDDVWQNCLQRVAAATAARAMRAIPSERRAEASRQNGKKGGRPIPVSAAVARIFDSVGGYRISDETLDYLDEGGPVYPSKAEAMRAAKSMGYTHATGSGTYWDGVRKF